MPILKCESCGADLDFAPNAEIASCLYCGRNNTRPRVLDDQRAAILNRANDLRLRNDYDGATRLYETLITHDATEHKAYWGLLLCKYGIEHVEEDSRRVPTFHRLSHDPILADPDYQNALERADPVTRAQYEKDAAEIAQIQKRVLAIVQKETACDVFICYKESDATGGRTRESGDAQDIYYFLQEQKLNVFFSRITLKGKLGGAYEPHIFAALNSAKVMLVIANKPAHVNAPWVKNEWSRYLALKKKDPARKLIVCYRDMRPEDLPQELAYLQNLNLNEFKSNDTLLANIRTVIPLKQDEADAARELSPQTLNLLNLGDQFLQNGTHAEAAARFNKVIETDYKSARAYIGLMLAELRLPNLDALIKLEKDWQKPAPDTHYATNWRNALTHAAPDYKKQLETILEKRGQYYLGEVLGAAYAALKEGAFDRARQQFETAAAAGYESIENTLGQVLAAAKLRDIDALIDMPAQTWRGDPKFQTVLREATGELKDKLDAIAKRRDPYFLTDKVNEGYARLTAKDYPAARANFDQVLNNGYKSAQARIGRILANLALPALDDLVQAPKHWSNDPEFQAAMSEADDTYRDQLKDILARRKNWLATEVVTAGYAALADKRYSEARDKFKFVHTGKAATARSHLGAIMAACEVPDADGLVKHEEDWRDEHESDVDEIRRLADPEVTAQLDDILKRREHYFLNDVINRGYEAIKEDDDDDDEAEESEESEDAEDADENAEEESEDSEDDDEDKPASKAGKIFALVEDNGYTSARLLIGKVLVTLKEEAEITGIENLVNTEINWLEFDDAKEAIETAEGDFKKQLDDILKRREKWFREYQTDEGFKKLRAKRFSAANEHFDSVVKNNYGCARVHLGKLLAALELRKPTALISYEERDWTGFADYKRAMQCPEDEWTRMLTKFSRKRRSRIRRGKVLHVFGKIFLALAVLGYIAAIVLVCGKDDKHGRDFIGYLFYIFALLLFPKRRIGAFLMAIIASLCMWWGAATTSWFHILELLLFIGGWIYWKFVDELEIKPLGWKWGLGFILTLLAIVGWQEGAAIMGGKFDAVSCTMLTVVPTLSLFGYFSLIRGVAVSWRILALTAAIPLAGIAAFQSARLGFPALATELPARVMAQDWLAVRKLLATREWLTVLAYLTQILVCFHGWRVWRKFL